MLLWVPIRTLGLRASNVEWYTLVMNKYSELYRQEMQKSGFTIPEVVGTGLIGGGLGSLQAPSGNKWPEGFSRGASVGIGTGIGHNTGLILANLLGDASPKLRILKGAPGLLTIPGGIAGYLGTNKLIGPPSWERGAEVAKASKGTISALKDSILSYIKGVGNAIAGKTQ